jgi:NAD(P)-dependent dehydrogenase (short-subunit alcohol dehydrogenase family)
MAHALVTGANRGLGLEFVRQLLARGRRVIAACRQPGKAMELTRLAGEHPGHLMVLPLVLPETRSIADLARTVEAMDLHVDLLINNAGVSVAGEHFGTVELEGLRTVFGANAAGPFLLTQALAPSFADAARVVNITSELGSIAQTTSVYTPSYAISKAALNMATRLLSIALAEHGGAIVVALSPGWARTDMGGDKAPLSVEESVAAMLAVIDGLEPRHTGQFLSHDGTGLPW